MEDLEGKVAVVTGAASGIGLGLARQWAAEGMHVVLADVEEPALEQAAADLRASGAEALAVRCDVSVRADVEELRDAAVERFGAVHVLCNNAGVSGGGFVADLRPGDWDWVLGVNLFGVLHGVDAFLPGMVERGEPAHVVNTASMAGHLAAPGMGPYAVSKFGVVALSEVLRAELLLTAPHVGVSVLCPGWVDTKIAESERNRPARHGEATSGAFGAEQMTEIVKGLLKSGATPADIAAAVHTAVREGSFWILPSHEFDGALRSRFDSILERGEPTSFFG